MRGRGATTAPWTWGWEGRAGDQSLVWGPGQGTWDRNAGCRTQEKGQEHRTRGRDQHRLNLGLGAWG